MSSVKASALFGGGSSIGEIRPFSAKSFKVTTESGEEWLQSGYIQRDVTGYSENAKKYFFGADVTLTELTSSTGVNDYQDMFVNEDTTGQSYIWARKSSGNGYDTFSRSGGARLSNTTLLPDATSMVFFDGKIWLLTNASYLTPEIKTYTMVDETPTLTQVYNLAAMPVSSYKPFGLVVVGGVLYLTVNVSTTVTYMVNLLDFIAANEFPTPSSLTALQQFSYSSAGFFDAIIGTASISSGNFKSIPSGVQYKYLGYFVTVNHKTLGDNASVCASDLKTSELFFYSKDTALSERKIHKVSFADLRCVGEPVADDIRTNELYNYTRIK